MPPSAPAPGRSPGTSVRIYLPDERLQSFFTFYYFVECDQPIEDFLYPEWGNIRFSVRGSWTMQLGDNYPDEPIGNAIFGPTDRAARIFDSFGKTVGFGMTPLGWERFVGIPAHRLANRVAVLADQFGPSAEDLQRALAGHNDDRAGVALFDQILLAKLALTAPNSAAAINADRVLRDRPADVATFAAASGVSVKVLGRICRQVFGFTAKRLLRRQRFLDTLGNIRITDQPEFGSLIDPQYFDQSHFNHEFREFMGLSPRAYLSAERPLMGQAASVQRDTGIPLSFRLPPQPDA
ncbi:MAG: helix-turn-helix domain-containing protein [Pseudomonadota bacterium]